MDERKGDKMKTFRVNMIPPPVWCIVKANSKEDAIDIAIDRDDWIDEMDYGGEDYEAKEIKLERKKK
jgi:hypothetical protein